MKKMIALVMLMMLAAVMLTACSNLGGMNPVATEAPVITAEPTAVATEVPTEVPTQEPAPATDAPAAATDAPAADPSAEPAA